MNVTAQTTIIGIDPGLQHTGWGVVNSVGNRVSWVAHGVINPNVNLPLAQRLAVLTRELRQILAIYKPSEAAVEETFFANSAKTSLLLGHARGAALAVLAGENVEVTEYATRRVKKAIVGTGAAEKSQIAFMVKRLLPNCDELKSDSADALAVALCHATERKMANALLRARQ
jgi:crossover junction endodeoxyribonuclease RuvC